MTNPPADCPLLSLECADVMDFLAARRGLGARALITDMPYSSGGATRDDRGAPPIVKYGVDEHWTEDFEGDSRGDRAFTYWCSEWMRLALRAVAPGGVLACFIDWRQLDNVNLAIEAAGWVRRGLLAWDKGEGARPQPGRPRQQLEFVTWASRGAYRDLGLPPFRGSLPYAIRKTGAAGRLRGEAARSRRPSPRPPSPRPPAMTAAVGRHPGTAARRALPTAAPAVSTGAARPAATAEAGRQTSR